ncbi:hypothetical protein CDAR_31121 [Caerostris darwini]|uniref:Secreted protein n=1 Tax=Caerostris darwini TaxID=1538125 RepID=A0AAV4S0E2_9ARAC|nr:hypothetical protein CDAR_31121 [Caerostris darwini]
MQYMVVCLVLIFVASSRPISQNLNPTGSFGRFMSIKLIPCSFQKAFPNASNPKATGSLKEVRGNCDISGPAEELRVLRCCWFPVVYKHTCGVSERLRPHNK